MIVSSLSDYWNLGRSKRIGVNLVIKSVGGAPVLPKHRLSCHCGAVVLELADCSRPASDEWLNVPSPSMYQLSPPESAHAVDLEKLLKPEVTFWSAWEGSHLLGCGALKELDRKHGEVKSMRTPTALRRKGVGRAILAHIIEVARSRSYERLSLETGSMEAF